LNTTIKVGGVILDEKIAKIFEVPSVAKAFISYFLNEDERAAILVMWDKKYKLEDLRILLKDIAVNPDILIKSAYSRAVFNKVDIDGTIYYQISNFYTRMAYFAQYEQAVWKNIPEKDRQAIDKWYVNAYAETAKIRLKDALDGKGLIENAYFTSLDEILNVIDHLHSDPYVVPCNCKSVAMNCEKPREVCISTNRGINSQWDRGHGKLLTKDAAKELIKSANRHGLMQTFESGMDICNCCGCCCYPIRTSKMIGAKGVWPKQQYAIVWDSTECINCGKCTVICNFGAFKWLDKKVVFNEKACWGCTICSSNCPAKAISIKKIK